MSGPVATIGRDISAGGDDAVSDPKFKIRNGDLAVTKRE
jgi:hypothetical protein